MMVLAMMMIMVVSFGNSSVNHVPLHSFLERITYYTFETRSLLAGIPLSSVVYSFPQQFIHNFTCDCEYVCVTERKIFNKEFVFGCVLNELRLT